MDTGQRVLMGLISVSSVVLLIDGLQKGVMLGDYIDYHINERPVRFALSVIGSVCSIVICTVFAAGYGLEDVWNSAEWVARHS